MRPESIHDPLAFIRAPYCFLHRGFPVVVVACPDGGTSEGYHSMTP